MRRKKSTFRKNRSRVLFFLVLAVLGGILLGGVFVLAYGTNNPPVFGHSFGEIEIDYIQVQKRVTGTCSSGSSIRVINSQGQVTCETDDVGYEGAVVIDAYWTWLWNSPPSCPSGFTTRNTGVAGPMGQGDLYFVFCVKYAN